jgi:hypothetical protein
MAMNRAYIPRFNSVRVTELTHGRATRTYEQGRVCAASGCRTHLSVYNPNHRCGIHDHTL